MNKYSLIRPKDTALKAGISVSHLYHLVSAGKFPSPISLSERISVFIEAEVDEWIKAKISESREES